LGALVRCLQRGAGSGSLRGGGGGGDRERRYRYINKTICDPDRHTFEQWCGLEGIIDDMLAAGVDAPSGQLSPGMWCVRHTCMSSSFAR
jgi:hypothetical protein